MLKCAPEKSEGFKTEPFEMSISTERGCSSGSEKAKPRERERKRVYCTIKTTTTIYRYVPCYQVC